MRLSLETGAVPDGALSRYLRSDGGVLSVTRVREKCDEASEGCGTFGFTQNDRMNYAYRTLGMDARIPGGTPSWNPTLAHRTRKDGAPGFAQNARAFSGCFASSLRSGTVSSQPRR